MSGEVDDITTYLVVIRNDETSIDAAEPVTHKKGLHATFTFSLKVTGVNAITCTWEIVKFRCGDYCTSL